MCYSIGMSVRALALVLVLGMTAAAVACGSDSDETSPIPTSGTPEATTSQTPATMPSGSDLSKRGEEVEKVTDTAVQRVTWADGKTYEEILPTLVLRTIGRPDAPSGRRVVARWLDGTRWLVSILTRVEDRSTDPATVIDLRAEFYYDETSKVFEPANGRGYFALKGTDPCASEEPSADLCPLDKEVTPQ